MAVLNEGATAPVERVAPRALLPDCTQALQPMPKRARSDAFHRALRALVASLMLARYFPHMPSVAQIEESIETLPAAEFFSLLGWMAERHLTVLASGEFEAPELEAELLKSLDSPRHAVDKSLFDGIRAGVAKTAD